MTPDNKQSTVIIYNRNFKNAMKSRLRTYVKAIDETAKKNIEFNIHLKKHSMSYIPHRSPLKSTKNAGSSRANCNFVSRRRYKFSIHKYYVGNRIDIQLLTCTFSMLEISVHFLWVNK